MKAPSQSDSSGRDPHLWQIAKARAGFKYHLGTYIFVIGVLWAIWFFNSLDDYGDRYMWPIWPTLGWGIGLFFHFLGAYVYPKENQVEKEYQQLLKQRNKY